MHCDSSRGMFTSETTDLVESHPVRHPDLELGQLIGQHGLGTQCEDACGRDALALEGEAWVQEHGVIASLWGGERK